MSQFLLKNFLVSGSQAMLPASLLFLLSCWCCRGTMASCRDPMINELNPGSENNEFFEIRLSCDEGTVPSDLNSYRLLVFEAQGQDGGGAHLELYAQLENPAQPYEHSTTNSYFYLLGDDPLTSHDKSTVHPQQTFTSPKVRSRAESEKPKKTGEFPSFAVASGNRSPFGVLLLKVSSLSDEDKVRLDNELQGFSKEVPRPPLTEEAIVLIKKDGVLLDAVAYGRRTFQTTCDIFLQFVPRWSIFKDYVLRDWDSTDHSLNFCGDPNLTPFQVAAFKTGKATPGSPNDCSGVQFLLDMLIALSAVTVDAMEQAAYSVPQELRAKFQRVYIGEDIQDQAAKVADPSGFLADTDTAMASTSTVGEYTCASTHPYGDVWHLRGTSVRVAVEQKMEHEHLFEEKVNQHLPEEDTIGAVAAADYRTALESQMATDVDVRSDKKRRLSKTVQDDPDTSGLAKKQMKLASESKWWTDRNNFRDEWLNKIRTTSLNQFLSENWFRHGQKSEDGGAHLRAWVKLDINDDNPAQSTISCRICEETMGPNAEPPIQMHVQQPPELSTPVRINEYAPDKNRFLKKLKNHEIGTHSARKKTQTNIHQAAVAHLIRTQEEKEKGSFEVKTEPTTEQMAAELTAAGKYQATANLMTIVYTEIKMNIPFDNHQQLSFVLADSIGAKLGSLHRSRKSAVKMLNFISIDMHKTLCEHLCSWESGPLSLIIDTTTHRNNHFLIMYFRALEKTIIDAEPEDGGDGDTDAYIRPSVYFYKLIELTGESAAQQMQAIIDAFEADKQNCGGQFVKQIKTKLIGFGSDGAAVNIGSQNGIFKKLRDWAGNQKLIGVHCMAHRLELAVGWSWNGEMAFGAMEKLTNNLYSFFGSARNRAALNEATKSLELTFYELNYIHAIRWVSSAKNAMEKIWKGYPAIHGALGTIANSDDFGATAKNQAATLAEKLEDKNAVSFLAFILVSLTVLGHLSRELQSKQTTLVGTFEKIKAFEQRLNSMKEGNDERFLTSLLTVQAKCSNDDDDPTEPCMTLESYETAKYVTFEGILLKDGSSASQFSKLSEIKERFLGKLLDGSDKYFSSNQIVGALSVFEPQDLPPTRNEVKDFGAAKIGLLARHFGRAADVENTLLEWQELLARVLGSTADRMHRKNSNPQQYWGHVLGSTALSVHDLPLIQELLRIALILPAGSVDAERGFSILKHIRYDRRSSLGTTALDATLRIRINGPDPVNFNGVSYARKWHLAGNFLSDGKRNVASYSSAEEKKLDAELNFLLEEHKLPSKKLLPTSNIFL